VNVNVLVTLLCKYAKSLECIIFTVLSLVCIIRESSLGEDQPICTFSCLVSTLNYYFISYGLVSGWVYIYLFQQQLRQQHMMMQQQQQQQQQLRVRAPGPQGQHGGQQVMPPGMGQMQSNQNFGPIADDLNIDFGI